MDSLPENVFFCDLHVLARKLASPFGHPTQVSTQVQLTSTCDYLPVRFTRALRYVSFTVCFWQEAFGKLCNVNFELKLHFFSGHCNDNFFSENLTWRTFSLRPRRSLLTTLYTIKLVDLLRADLHRVRLCSIRQAYDRPMT